MVGGYLKLKVWLFLHHNSQMTPCASFSEERTSCTAAIWALLNSSILLSPLTADQAAFPQFATRVDCEIHSRNSIMQTDEGRKQRHQAPTKLSLTLHSLLSMNSVLP